MIRKLILTAAGALVLGGCMTGGYNYRGGAGDYYYGQPGTDYRYHSTPYGYGYYGYDRYRYGGYYGYPYAGHYGYPWGYPYRRPVIVVRPGTGGGGGHSDHDDRDPPWRDLDRVMRPSTNNHLGPQRVVPSEPSRPTRAVRPSREDSGSRMGKMIRRARVEERRDER